MRWRLVASNLRVKSDSTVFLDFFGQFCDHFFLSKGDIVQTVYMITGGCIQGLLTESLPASTVIRGSNFKSEIIALVGVPTLHLLHWVQFSDNIVYFSIRFPIKEPCLLMWRRGLGMNSIVHS